jgi:tripartite-type tricarboxylate transporter receptor subunit TctC
MKTEWEHAMTIVKRLAVAMVGLSFMLTMAVRAEDYPTRQVTVVVPLGAGGALDILARTLGAKLADRLGKPFVVENRTGGGTVTAAVLVAKAPADGYTLMFTPSGTLATNATLYKNLPYNPAADFVPIALLVKVPFVLIVDPSLPVRSISDLIKYAKERPGTISYSSTGTGAVPHLAAELLKSSIGIEMTHVPYRGAVQALTDVMAGHVQLTFADPSISPPFIEAGKVRALGVSSLTRLGNLPDIPLLAEAGVPGFEAVSWHLVVAPAHTPPAIVNKLHDEIKALVAQPEIQQQMIKMGLIPVDTPSVEQLQKFAASEIVRWGKLVRQAGIAGSE